MNSELCITGEYQNKRYLSHAMLHVYTYVRTYVHMYVHVHTYVCMYVHVLA